MNGSKENETRDETDEQVTIKMPDFDDEESDEEEDEYESMGGDESDDEPEDDEDADEEEGEVEDGEEESVEVEEIKTTGDKGGKFTGHYDDLDGATESLLQNTMHTTTKICMLMRTLVLRLLLT